MAEAIPTTPVTATEVLPHQDSLTPSTISLMFSHLLDALARHVAAERDLEGVDFWDVAFLQWRVEAEESYTVMATLLSAIQREMIACHEDEPLQCMASLIDHMVGSEESGTFQRLHCSLPRFDAWFNYRNDSAVAEPVSQMLMTARGLIEELSTLSLYAEVDEDDMDISVSAPCDQLAA